MNFWKQTVYQTNHSDTALKITDFYHFKGGRPGQTNEADSHAILNKFAELGGNFIDIADVYQCGKAEEYVGTWFPAHNYNRDKFVIATKGRFSMDGNDVNCQGLSRKHLIASVEGSLRRLQTDYIDLYQVCFWILLIVQLLQINLSKAHTS